MIGVVLATWLSTGTAPTAPSVDLRQMGHVSSKGRVQDKEYNDIALVNELVTLGPAAIPLLVSKLDDPTPIERRVFDFWGTAHVGDVALVILCNLFRRSDWKSTTVPGMDWDTLLERKGRGDTGYGLLHAFLKKHGRPGLRRKVEGVLERYKGRFVWDDAERCFKPESP